MGFVKLLSALALIGSAWAAQAGTDDPVMKARTLRAQAQGINEADLPPVPRSVTEPPPLPPPETHLKDTRGGRVAKIKGKTRHGKEIRVAGKASGKSVGKAGKRQKVAGTAPKLASKGPAHKGGKRAPGSGRKGRA